jgi:hypothetical protein
LRQLDVLDVILDQGSHGGAIELSVDSKRVANGNRWGLPTAWYLLLGYNIVRQKARSGLFSCSWRKVDLKGLVLAAKGTQSASFGI